MGLIVTSLPAFAVSAFAGTDGTETVGHTLNVDESGGAVLVEGDGAGDGGGAEELEVPGDELDGAPPKDGGDGKNNPSGQQGDVNSVQLGCGSPVTYTEETLTVPAQYVWYYNDEYIYIVFRDTDTSEDSEETSLSQIMTLKNIQSVNLQLNLKENINGEQFDVYPLAMPFTGVDEADLSPHMTTLEEIERIFEELGITSGEVQRLIEENKIQEGKFGELLENEGVSLEEIERLSKEDGFQAEEMPGIWKPAVYDLSGKLMTREILGVSQIINGNDYSIDVTKDITLAQMGELGASVMGEGYYGYALKLEGGIGTKDGSIIDDKGEAKPKLVVTYQKETERTPNETDIEAADAMLEQRQMMQGTLEGSGTVEDPYLIYDADDLQGMAENDNACYKLMCDIDLEGKNWRPPGYYYWYPFMGYLDGNGHTIKNLHVGGTGDDAWNTNAGGLFGYFEGRVENLHVETVQAKREGVDFFGYAGGIAGVANAPAEIVNCSFNGYVSGNGSIGGLVGAAYPGVIIENCAAIGTVDMSDSFAYMKDDKWENTKAIWDSGMEIVTYGLSFLCISDEYTSKTVLEGENPFRAIVEIVMDKITNFPIDSLMNTEYMQAMRKSNIGGLVGLNYGDIRNSYSSVDIYNLEGYMQDISVFGFTFSAYNNLSKVGSIVGLNIGDYGVINNCFYDKTKPGNGAEDSEVIKGKDTDDLKSPGLFGGEANSVMHGTSASSQWDYSVSRKSTGGLPLPKTNQVNRDLEDKDCVYYNSRVLMKTRPDFIIGTEVVELGEKQYIYNDGWYEINNGVASIEADAQSIDNLENGEGKATGAIYCTRCDELTAEAAQYAQGSEERTALENQIAVTGRFQRGSDARPYHVHDIDSLLAMQDSKESHFILCSDIDFKINETVKGNISLDEGKSIQKYWWPAGKSHTSPIKGSLKGNVAYDEEIIPITDGISPKSVEEKMQRFAIKNLTVQSNRHVGLFACLRGAFSDINIQLSEGNWENWKNGIREDKKDVEGKVIAGLSTIGDKSSAGAVAGETVNGAIIRNCIVTGTVTSDASTYTHEPSTGVIKGALRSGGIVGMNNRGCTVEGCEALVYIDAENYETVFIEDVFGTGVEIVKAGIGQLGQTTDEILNLTDIINGDMGKWKKGAKALLSTASLTASIVDGPIANYVYSRWGNVCVGGLVGENYGTIKNSVAYSESQIKSGEPFSGWALNCRTAVGRSNPYSEEDVGVRSKTTSQSFYLWLENMNGKGSKEEPLLVGDEKDLQRLAEHNSETLDGIYIKQVTDITITSDGGSFEGFTKDFKGIYDGNGCSISGIDSDSPLFKTLDGGVVKNLELRSSTFECSSAIAGVMKNNSVIQNCFIADDVTIGSDSVSYASGFADRMENSTIYNVINYGKLAASSRICGIAREAVGESFILNSYINTQKTATAPATSDYALVYSADGSVRYKNCYWEGEKEKPQGINFTDEDSCEKFTETHDIFNLMTNFENIKPDEANGYPEYVSYDEPMVWGVLDTGEKDGFCFLFNTFKLYGAGIKNNPYLIQNEEDFYSFVRNIFLGTDTEGLYFLQTDDIQATTATLDYLKAPESKVYPIFKGNYDGGKHTISGLDIDNVITGTEGKTKAALFAETEGALIENLGIKDSSFEADIAAPFIGEARKNEIDGIDTIVRNCWVEDDVTISGTTSGGIVGNIEDAVIYNCAVYSTSPYETNNMKDLPSGDVYMCILRNSDGNYGVIKQAEDIDESCEPETILSQAFLSEINDEISGFGIEGLRSWTLSENGEMLLPIGAVVELDTAEPTTETEAIPSSTSDEPDFAGGSGTETEPYLIENIAQLSRVKNYLKSGFHFKLVADLDFSGYSGNWVAIGTDADYFAFQGVFDGNGHTIKNLTMNSSASAGLFGYCAGTIKNLKIEGFEIDTTGTTAGALVAELCAGGRIEQCAVTNSNVDSAHYSGGIAGAAQKGSVIRNVYADNVSCSLSKMLYLNGAEDAGLGGGKDSQWGAGVLSTDLSAIMAGFDIIEPIIQLLNSNSATRIFGKLKDTIFSIAENGSQYRTAAAGGIVGFLGGTLENSWAYRKVGTGDEWLSMGGIGGGWLAPHEGILVGRNFYGTIEGNNYAVENKEFDMIRPIGNETGSNQAVTTVNVSSDEVKAESGSYYFTNEIVNSVNAPLDANRWTSEEKDDENNKYKYELKIFENPTPGLAKLDYEIIAEVPEIDEEDGFYMITDVNELAYVEYEGWSDYKLMNDIDLTGYNWVPLCREHDQYFDGTFDGQGYTIYGLNVETNENGGLFGYILGDVKNLNLGVKQVDAYGSAGGLAAGVYYPGKISKVAVLDNDIAVAMMGERILNGYRETMQLSDKEKKPFSDFTHILDDYVEVGNGWDEDLNAFYNEKNKTLDQNNIEQHYGGITHIKGGGNGDGAGVGGLAGIVGKDVVIENCYSRVNVSNANFVIVKEMDFTGIVMNIVSSATNDLLIPVGSRIKESKGNSTDSLADKLVKLKEKVGKLGETYESLSATYYGIRGKFESSRKSEIYDDEYHSSGKEYVNIDGQFDDELDDEPYTYEDIKDGLSPEMKNQLKELYHLENIDISNLDGELERQKIYEELELEFDKRMEAIESFNELVKEKNEVEDILNFYSKPLNEWGDEDDARYETDFLINPDEFYKEREKLNNKLEELNKKIKESESMITSYKEENIALYEKIQLYINPDKNEIGISQNDKESLDIEKKLKEYQNKYAGQYDLDYEADLKNIDSYIYTSWRVENKARELSEINAWLSEYDSKALYELTDEDIETYEKNVLLKDKLESDLAVLREKMYSSEETAMNSIEAIEMQERCSYYASKSESELTEEEKADFDALKKKMENAGVSERKIDDVLIDFEKDDSMDSEIDKELNEASMQLKNAKKNLDDAEEEKEKFIEAYGDEENINSNINTNAWMITILKVIRSIGNWGFNIVMEFDDSCVGGLVGESRGRLVNCYSMGQVNSNFFDAGAKSGFWHSADLFDSAYSGRLVGRVRTGADGGEVGRIASTNQLVINCYYYGGYYGGKAGKEIYGEGLGNPCMTALDWENDKGFDMKSMLTFNGFDFSKTWKMGDYSKYPELVNGSDTEYLNSSTAQTQELLSFESGDGSKENPFIIKEESQFLNMARFSNMDYYYRLEADLEFTRNDGEVVLDDYGQPIVINGKVLKTAGSSNDSFSDSTDFFGGSGIGRYDDFGGNDNGFTEALKRFFVFGIIHSTEDLNEKMLAAADEGEAFAGHFDGNGHSITYKSIKDSEQGYYAGGLFPLVSGSIENLEVICKGVNSKARYNGLLAGKLLGGAVIENVSVTYAPDSTGTETYKLTGRLAAGGLVGYAEDNTIISNCALYDQNSQIPYDDGSGKIGAITGESLGDIEYVYYDTATHCSDKELMPVGNSSDKLHCIYSADTEESMTESYFKGFDFNNVWTMAANAQSKNVTAMEIKDKDGKVIDSVEIQKLVGAPVLRALNSTPLFDYRRALDEACEKTDTVIEGAGTMADPFLIDSAMDFEAINEVMKDGHTFSGVYFRQNDTFISLRKPFSQGTVFGGNYDGNGHRLFICIDTPRDYALTRPFSHLNGAIFRNCDITLNAVINEGFASSAHNTMFLNCRFLNEGTEDADIIYSASGVSAVNCLFIRCRLYDPELEGKRDGKTVIISAPYQYACFNGDIVGLKDVNQSVEINNYTWDKRYLSDDEKGKDYTYSNTYNALAAMTGVPDNLKPWIAHWKETNGAWDMQQSGTISFDLGDGINIEKITQIHYKGEGDSRNAEFVTSDEDTYSKDQYGNITDVSAPAGTRLEIEISYDGEEKDVPYVMVTGKDAQDIPNLRDLILSLITKAKAEDETASYEDIAENVGLLPENTKTIIYDVEEGRNTVSLYKQGVYKKADVITDKEYQGAVIEKIRLHYTDRIFDEVGTKQADISGFDSYSTSSQKVLVTYKGKTYEAWIDLLPAVSWSTASSMDIAKLPDKILYKQGEKIDLTGMEITLNREMTDEITRPIEELFKLGEETIGDETIQKIIQYEEAVGTYPTGEHEIVLFTPSFDQDGEQTVNMEILGMPIEFEINVEECIQEVKGIEIESLGKTQYIEGAIFDPAGFTFKMHYNDGTYATMSIGQILGDGGSITYDMSPLGDKMEETRKATISYKGNSIDFNITIRKINLTADEAFGVYGATMTGGNGVSQYLILTNDYGNNSSATSHGYINFDISQLKEELDNSGLEIKKATLRYKARTNSDNKESTIYVRGAEEKSIASWSETKPALYDILGSSQLKDNVFKDIETDVTAYVQGKIDGNSLTFGFTSRDNCDKAILEAGTNNMPELIIETVEREDQPEPLEPAQAFFVQRGNGTVGKQAPDAAGRMMIKNNGSTGSNTRQGYITFDLSVIKSKLAEEGLEIDTAALRYNASVNQEGYSRTLYLSGVNQEKSTWNNWNDQPGISSTGLLGTSLLTGTDVKETETDVTEYVKNRISSSDTQVTFGFTASECGGEMIYLVADGEEAPELIIYTKEKRDVDSIEILQAPKVIYARNQVLDLSGGLMKVEYADGTVDVISTGINEVIATGFSSAAAGIKEVTLTYRQKSDTYNVTIK